MKKKLLALLLAFICIDAAIAREVLPLNSDWRFYFSSERSADNARRVDLPHTWIGDGGGLMASNYLSMGNYTRSLKVPMEWRNKRVFVKFHGVQSIADLFVNDRYIGGHSGGATAFTFEITDKLKYGVDNLLHLLVNSSMQSDVLPTSLEHDIYGGIYRDVELIITDKLAVSPLHYGSDGVLIHTSKVLESEVEGSADIFVTSKAGSQCRASLRIFDANDAQIFEGVVPKAKLQSGRVEVPYKVKNVSLWSPSTPNMYRFEVALSDGDYADTVSVWSGFRKIGIEPKTGALTINDSRVDVRGVALYHDHPRSNGAITKRDYLEDLALVQELGANAIHSAVYPHDQFLYEWCNREGIITWVDFPLVKAPFLADRAYYPTEGFKSNGMQQLCEIVMQNYNHPSVVMWGVFSMLWSGDDDVVAYIEELNKLSHSLDRSRPTVAMSDQDGRMNNIPDLVVWKQSMGWSRGKTSDISMWSNAMHTSFKNFRSAVAYGENGSVNQQSGSDDMWGGRSLPADTWFPETRQTQFHEDYADQLLPDSLFWGVWLTNMFDFKSSRSTLKENRAGLVSFDRRDRKDVFYLYKSVWNPQSPTLKIAGARDEYRAEGLHTLKVYASDTVAPTLRFRDSTYTMQRAAQGRFELDSLNLTPGVNVIEVEQGDMRDRAEFIVGSPVEPRGY